MNSPLHRSASPEGLVISEIFGPTLQGEGPSLGRRAAFIRLGGCNLTCSWCFAPDTPVLMADWTTKPIAEVQVGDYVWSYRKRRYEVARVERVITRQAAERVSVRFGDQEVVCTPDHIFATPHQIDGRRRSRADELLGRHVRVSKLDGWLPDEAVRTEEWWTGWLQGVVLGDGHVGQSEASPYPKVWLRVCDKELAEAFSAEVNRRGARTTVREQKRRTARDRIVYSVACALSRVPEVIGLPDTPDGIAGFLAGFFDAEGSVSRGQISMSQADNKTLDRIAKMCESLGIPVTVTAYDASNTAGRVTINGLANADRFFRLTRPILTRKSQKHRRADRMLQAVKVEQVKQVEPGPVVNLTTTTGYFFAGGALVEQCDTPYTWAADRFDLRKELTRTSVADILDKVTPMDVPLVVITGGEPLLQQHYPDFLSLVGRLVAGGHEVEIETNGTRAPRSELWAYARAVRFNVSFKLANSGVLFDKRIVREALREFAILAGSRRAIFKTVCRDETDVAEVAQIARDHGIDPAWVWVMPEGTTAADTARHLQQITPHVIDAGFNLTPRLHVLAWGDQRGH